MAHLYGLGSLLLHNLGVLRDALLEGLQLCPPVRISHTAQAPVPSEPLTQTC